MSLIIAYKYRENGTEKVMLAGEDIMIDTENSFSHGHRKVFIKQDMMMGYAGEPCIGQFLMSKVFSPRRKKKRETPADYMMDYLVPYLRNSIVDNNMHKQEDEEQASMGTSVLVVIEGQIFVIDECFVVTTLDTDASNFCAVGITDHAIGYMYAVKYPSGHYPPNRRITEGMVCGAIDCARKFYASIGPLVTFIIQEPGKKGFINHEAGTRDLRIRTEERHSTQVPDRTADPKS